MTATAAKVQFRVGARVIPAPIQNGTLDENVKQLMKSFPMFRWTTVLPSDAVVLADGTIEYNVVLPPAKTNG